MTQIIVLGASNKTWLRQKLDPRSWVRWMGESLISDYAEKMEILREVDDNIAEWTEDLDSIVSQMKKALATSRLVDLAILLNKLNTKLKSVLIEGKKVEDVAEKALREYESEHELEIPEGLATQAGIWDDFKRKWFQSRLELKNRKERNKALKEIINDADKTVKAVKLILSNMTSARVAGQIGKYIDEMKKIEKLQSNFQTKALNIYNKYLNSFVEEALNKKQQSPKEIVNDVVEPSSDEIPVTHDDLVETTNVEIPDLEMNPTVPAEQPVVTVDSPKPKKSRKKEEPVFDLVNKKNKSEIETVEQPKVEENLIPEIINKIKFEPSKGLGEKVVSDPEEELLPDTPPAEPMEEENIIENAIEQMKKDEEKVAQHYEFMTKLAQLIQLNANTNDVVTHLLNYADQIELEDKTASLKLIALAEGLLDE